MKTLFPRFIMGFMLFVLATGVTIAQVIDSDDFEANNVGDQPVGWTISNAGGGVAVIDDPVAEGVRSLRLQGSLGNDAYIYRSPSVSSDFVLEFYVLLPDTGQPNEELGNIELLNYYVRFGLGSSTSEGVIYQQNQSDGTTITTNQYHHVRLEADYETYVYRVIVDGADTLKYSISSRFGSLELRAKRRSTILNSGLVYIDSIVVSSGTFDFTPAPVSSLNGPSNGSTGLGASDIYFYWSSVSQITGYQLQIATDSTFASGIVVDVDNGTSTARYVGIPPLSISTQYYWRVRANNANGAGDWSTVWSFTTIAPLEAPTPNNPTDMSVVNDQVDIYMTWSYVAGRTGYEIIVATDSADFAGTMVFQGPSSGTNTYYYLLISGNLQFNTQYFWKVRTLNQAGYGPWSEVSSFYTVGPPEVVHSNPADMATVTADNPSFSYGSVTTTTDTFFVQIVSDTNNIAGSTVVDTSRTSTSFTVSISRFTAGGTYYWRTSGNNLAGMGPWSVWRKFTIHEPPNPPTHYSPGDASTITTTTPYIDWSTVSTPYNLQVATDVGFSNIVVDETLPSSSSFTIPSGTPLAIGTTYYWRVRAMNNVGWGPFSTPWSFTTPGIPPAPVLTSPAPGTTDLFGNVLFTWNSAPGRDTTRIQVTTDTSTASARVLAGVLGKIQGQPTVWEFYSAYYYYELLIYVTQFGLNTPIWVRLQDHNQLGWGPFSAWVLLHTLRPPAPPISHSPANGATGVRFSGATFQTVIGNYSSAPRVFQNLTVLHTTDGGGSWGPIFTEPMTKYTYTEDPYFYLNVDLAPKTEYQWFVTTYNEAGSVNSSTYSCTTLDPLPSIHCVGDVLGDQGGSCELQVNACGFDQPSTYVGGYLPISSGDFDDDGYDDFIGDPYGSSSYNGTVYTVYRLHRPEELQSWNREIIKDAFDKLPEKMKLATKTAGVDTIFIWEPLGGFLGIGKPQYVLSIPTRRDSGSGHRYWERYVVTAQAGGAIYISNADSGYSVDNLAPAPPAGSIASFNGGSVRIAWQPNNEKDLKEYVIYRTQNAGDDVKNLTPLATVTAPEYTDANPPSGQVFYFIVARDKNNNDSPPSTAGVVTGVETLEGVPTEFSLGQNYPNPFNPSTTIRFGLPEESSVTIQVINTLGQVVDEITNDMLPAGFFQVVWQADVPSGLYLYRMVASPVSAPDDRFLSIKKMVLLR